MEGERNICRLCDKKCETGEERIHCMGPCHRNFHAKCIGFTPVPLKFYRQCDNLFYECDECRDNPYKMINITLEKVLSFMCIFNERLNRQETKSDSIIKHFETLNGHLQKCEQESKAELNKEKIAVKDIVNESSDPCGQGDKKTVPEPVVLVQPKTKQKCSATRAALDEKNIPKKIAIECVNNVPNGGIKIHCKNKCDIEKLHKMAIKEMGEDYTIYVPKQRNPKIRVTNMCVKQSEVDIITSMKKQNEWIKDADLKVLHVYEVKYNETFGAIIEVDSKSFDMLMKEKKIIVGINSCDVTECLSVLRCYKCCGYNHKSNTCRNKKACLRCGGEHIIKECRADRNECINCKTAAEKLNIHVDWNHPAWSKSCMVLQKNMEREKLRTNYAK